MDAATSPRLESLHPQVDRVLAGEYSVSADYSTWRVSGTDDWLLMHTIAGSGRVTGSSGTVITTPGDTVLLRPHVRHDYSTATHDWTLVFAHFHPRAEWLPLLDWPIRAGTIGYVHSPDEVHRRIAAELRRTARAGVRPQLQSKLFAVNALESALLWIDTQNPLRGRTDARILRVMEHIASHLEGDLSVTALARVAHLSRSRLTHLFSEHLGASPQRFVERERMARAAQLLDFSDLSIGEIARAVGWDDPLYFSQRFRAFHRMSPTAYRRRSAPE
ncbi:helix-turn-helix domain-containing protein [Microbacterium sp. P5_E9]